MPTQQPQYQTALERETATKHESAQKREYHRSWRNSRGKKRKISDGDEEPENLMNSSVKRNLCGQLIGHAPSESAQRKKEIRQKDIADLCEEMSLMQLENKQLRDDMAELKKASQQHSSSILKLANDHSHFDKFQEGLCEEMSCIQLENKHKQLCDDVAELKEVSQQHSRSIYLLQNDHSYFVDKIREIQAVMDVIVREGR